MVNIVLANLADGQRCVDQPRCLPTLWWPTWSCPTLCWHTSVLANLDVGQHCTCFGQPRCWPSVLFNLCISQNCVGQPGVYQRFWAMLNWPKQYWPTWLLVNTVLANTSTVSPILEFANTVSTNLELANTLLANLGVCQHCVGQRWVRQHCLQTWVLARTLVLYNTVLSNLNVGNTVLANLSGQHCHCVGKPQCWPISSLPTLCGKNLVLANTV